MNNSNDDFLEYLFVTGQLDDFLGQKKEDEEELEDEEDNQKKKVR